MRAWNARALEGGSVFLTILARTPLRPPDYFPPYALKIGLILLLRTPRARSALRFFSFVHPFLTKTQIIHPHFSRILKSHMYLIKDKTVLTALLYWINTVTVML